MKTIVLTVHPKFPELDSIADAVRVLRQGGLVIFPTETVYGVGADNTNPLAVDKLKQVKKRAENKPFALLVGSKKALIEHSALKTTVVYKLIEKYWPGPLTVVVPYRESGKNIGLRMPDHPVALRLTQEFGRPIAAPSANMEGNPAPVTCQEALAELDGKVDLALDGGEARIGIASTVVEVTESGIKIVREGAVPAMDIEKTANRKTVLFVCTGNSCRSVMAEYFLKSVLKGRDDVEVLSAGTGVFVKSCASSETLNILREHGIEASGHQARAIDPILLRKADLIFTMTRSHRNQVIEMAPQVEPRVYLLKEFVDGPMGMVEPDVPDPIGQTYLEYRQCAEIIKQALHKIVELL